MAKIIITKLNTGGKFMPKKPALTTKDLSLLNDLLAYEQWAAKKSNMYGQSLTDQSLKDMCKTLEDNHNKNFEALFKLL